MSKQIAEFPDAGAVGPEDYYLVQQGTTGTALARITHEDMTFPLVRKDTLGKASGTATLDANARLTASQVPTGLTAGLTVKGEWDAATNTPTLANGTGTDGDLYIITTAGTTTLDGTSAWFNRDQVFFADGAWHRSPAIADPLTLPEATIDELTSDIINAGTVDISSGKATLATGTITTGTVGTLTSTTGTITSLTAGTIAIGSGTGTLSALTVSGTATVGHLAATTATASGAINGGTIVSSGAVTGASGTFTTGSIPTLAVSGTATVGHLAATSATASGALNAGTITTAGALTAATGTITNAAIPTLAVSGTATVGHLAATTIAAPAGTITAVNAGTITSSGAVIGATGTFTTGSIATLAVSGTNTAGALKVTDVFDAATSSPDLRLSILGDDFVLDGDGDVIGYTDTTGVRQITEAEVTAITVGEIAGIATAVPVDATFTFTTYDRGLSYNGTKAIVADPRLSILGDDIETDAAGNVTAFTDTAGVRYRSEMSIDKLTVGEPTVATDAATRGYVDGKSANPWLEPSRDYDAPTDGTTDASTEVNACFTAAVARGDRLVNVDHDYNVPTLDPIAGDLICVGDGRLLNAPLFKYVVPTTASPIPAIPRTLNARLHCPNAVAAAQGPGVVTVVFVGDSVSRWGVAEFSYFQTICAMVKEAFIRANPGVEFVWYNRGVGGANWETLGSIPANTNVPWYTDDLKPWLEYVEELEPDLVIVSCGRNGASAFEWGHMEAPLATIAGWTKPCDVLVCNSVGESQAVLTEDWLDKRTGYESAAQAIRSKCLVDGIGLIDSESVESMVRFGYAQEYLPQMRDTDAFGTGTGMQQIALPWTAGTEVYGYTIGCRVKIGGWDDMDNEIRFLLSGALVTDMAGCTLILRRDVGTDEISYEVRITDTEAGADETRTLVAETDAGVFCTDAEIITIVVGVQGSRLQLHFPTRTEPQAPLYILMQRNGGLFTPTITCAAGSIGTGAIELSGLTGKQTYCAASRPRPEVLYMPTITDREFGAEGEEDWGGSGPHPSSIAAPLIFGPAINVNDFTLI